MHHFPIILTFNVATTRYDFPLSGSLHYSMREGVELAHACGVSLHLSGGKGKHCWYTPGWDGFVYWKDAGMLGS